MGRNVKEVKVPVNGAIYRNSSNNGLIIEADGAQYLPSTSTCILTSTDYPKYVSLNSQTSSVYNSSINSSASKNFGTLLPSSTAIVGVNQYLPYFQAGAASYYPFSSRTGKYRYTGMTATNGTNTLVFQNPPGYKQSTSNGVGAAVFNASTGAFVTSPTYYPIACWYDSTTSLFRMFASPSTGASTAAVLYTSSTGATWTQQSTSHSVTSSPSFTYFGDSSYVKMGAVASGQKLFLAMRDSNGSNQTVLFRSTNGGATITEITTNVTGGAAYYNPAGAGGICNMSMNYDGTTLFIPSNTASWRYSTNDGTSFSNTTISGVTSSTDQNPVGVFSTGNNSSTFMMVYNAQVTSNRVFVTTDGGQTFTTYNWTPAATLNSSYHQCPGDYDATNTRWCFCYGTTSGWYAAVSTNNGATWTHNLIQSNNIDDSYRDIVFLDGKWYVYGQYGIWVSTDAATWTQITSSNATIGYGQPRMELTNYVLIGKYVIKKSDNSITAFNPQEIIANTSGYQKNLINYLGSDAIIQVQSAYTTYPLFVTSATAETANNFSPYPWSNQQQGTGGVNPVDIEYWRIK